MTPEDLDPSADYRKNYAHLAPSQFCHRCGYIKDRSAFAARDVSGVCDDCAKAHSADHVHVGWSVNTDRPVLRDHLLRDHGGDLEIITDGDVEVLAELHLRAHDPRVGG